MFTEEGRFHANEWPTLGVEIELALVDSQSLALRSVAPRILERVPPSLQDEVKPEFMQCYVELTSRVCRTVDEIGADLASKLAVVEGVARDLGTRLLWSGTHPFSAWQDQEITPKARYFRLAQLLGETVVRPVTFGLHVHVGVSSGNAAIRAMNGLREYLPLLLALSANSPFWHGRTTGHHSHRIEVLEGFPTSGFPPRLQSWAEYADLIERLKTSGCIESNHELWWDARPNSQFGTVEVRICDMPPDLSTVLAITGLIQCLVCSLANRVQPECGETECDSLIARQNRWRAHRYGLSARFVEPRTFELVPARTALRRLATSLMPMAKQLGCLHRLASIMELSIQPGGSEIQISNLKRLGNLSEVTRCLVDRATKGSEATVDHKAMHAPDAGCFDLNLSNQATAGARLVV